jgi:hypothetical protein
LHLSIVLHESLLSGMYNEIDICINSDEAHAFSLSRNVRQCVRAVNRARSLCRRC